VLSARERQVAEMEQRLVELRAQREPADLLPHPTAIKSYLTDLAGTLEADIQRPPPPGTARRPDPADLEKRRPEAILRGLGPFRFRAFDGWS
jgi:hypothetical protein